MIFRYYNIERDTEEILKLLEELSDDELPDIEEIDVILAPPNNGEISEADDEQSDSEQPNIYNLGRKMLSNPGEVDIVTVDGRKDLFEEEIDHEEIVECNQENEIDIEFNNNETQEQPIPQTKGKKKRKIRHWNDKSLLKVKQDVLATFNSEFRPDYCQIIVDGASPADLFKDIFDQEIINFICEQTILYARQNKDEKFDVTSDEMLKFLAILLVSGYNPLPNRRMFWESQPDTFNVLVANAMSRNKFEKILRYLHFNDNSDINRSDKLFKLRPLIDHCNKKFVEYARPFTNSYSVDEAMEPYYGRCSMKQFIRGKPIRFGYKFWCLTTSSGYLIKFIPYTGKFIH